MSIIAAAEETTTDMPADAEEGFVAEFAHMDMSKLKDGSYCIAVSTGSPTAVKYLCTTLHGPYNFIEMVQEVGDMWTQHQHHPKVIVMNKDPKAKVAILDENTIDYIECHYNDIIVEASLTDLLQTAPYTCEAGVVSEPEPTAGTTK